jgi:polysaccharide export outer membrane protein
MKFNYLIVVFLLIFSSCVTKNQLSYLNDADSKQTDIVNYSIIKDFIEIGDILKIDVQTVVPEASIPYNTLANPYSSQNIDILRLDGYLVDELKMINFPVLGRISVEQLNTYQLEKKINKLLLDGNHLTNPTVSVRRINSKFTVLGEIKNPGTFSYFDKNLNIFQALGYAGDLTIDGKRNQIKLIREQSGLRTVYSIALNNSELMSKPYYYIKNNDIIIVEPNFSKVKSAGFIGSPSSIASISSLLLSITLLILNK